MPATDVSTPYGLPRPTMHDARAAMHRVHGAGGPEAWDRLLTAAGLRSAHHDEADLPHLLEAMARLDPVSKLCAQALSIRLTSHAHLSAAHDLTRS